MKTLPLVLFSIWFTVLSGGQDTSGPRAYFAPTDTPERVLVSEILRNYDRTSTPHVQLSALANQAVEGKDLRLAEALVNNGTSANWLMAALRERKPSDDYLDEVVLLFLRSPASPDFDPSLGGYESGGAGRVGFFVLCLPTLNRHVGHFEVVADHDMLNRRAQRLSIAQRLEDALAKKKKGASAGASAPQPSPARTDARAHSSQSTPNSAERTLVESGPQAVSRWWWLGGLAVLTVLFFAVRKFSSRKTPA